MWEVAFSWRRAIRRGRAAVVWLALASFVLSGVVGCSRGGPRPSPGEKDAITRAVAAYYHQKDKEAKATVSEIEMTASGARATIRLSFPSFHSIATTRVLVLKRSASKWTVVKEEQ